MYRFPPVTRRRSDNKVKTQQTIPSRKKSTQLYLTLMRQKLLHKPRQETLVSYINKKYQTVNNSQEERYSLNSSIYRSDSTLQKDKREGAFLQKRKNSRVRKIIQVFNTKNQSDLDVKNQSIMLKVSQNKIKAKSLKNSIIMKNKTLINEQKFERIMTAYEQFSEQSDALSSLSKIVVPSDDNSMNNQALTEEQKIIKKFINQLRQINTFFGKLDDIVSVAFLKVGKIVVLDENKYLYRQNDKATTFFVILWGKVKLKNQYSKVVHYCITGDHLGQEIVIERSLYIRRKMMMTSRLINGFRPRLESVKTLTQCGFLQISPNNYNNVKKQLCILGLKEQVYLAQKMISWSMQKKANFRKA